MPIFIKYINVKKNYGPKQKKILCVCYLWNMCVYDTHLYVKNYFRKNVANDTGAASLLKCKLWSDTNLFLNYDFIY